jgi:hypothetical protein
MQKNKTALSAFLALLAKGRKGRLLKSNATNDSTESMFSRINSNNDTTIQKKSKSQTNNDLKNLFAVSFCEPA